MMTGSPSTESMRSRIHPQVRRSFGALAVAALLALSSWLPWDLEGLVNAAGDGYGCGPAPRIDRSDPGAEDRPSPRPTRPPRDRETPHASPVASMPVGPSPTTEPTPTARPEPTPEPTSTDPPAPPTREPTPRPTARPEPDASPWSSVAPETPANSSSRPVAAHLTRAARATVDARRIAGVEVPLLVLGLVSAAPTARPSASPPSATTLGGSPVASLLPPPSATPTASMSPVPAPSGGPLPPGADAVIDIPPRSSDAGPLYGVDISHWNGIVSFEAIRAAGGRFAFVKATQGTSFVDDTFAMQVANARAVGVLVGAYHFYDYRVEGAAQAEHLLAVIGSLGEPGVGLPPVVDIECYAPFGSADQRFARKELRAFVDTIYRRTGRPPIVYTSAYMWAEVTGADRSFGASPLWVACWDCPAPTLPAGWEEWAFWQTGGVTIPGVADLIGEDRFAGDIAALRSLVRVPIAGASARQTKRRSFTIEPARGEAEARVAVGDESWGPWMPAERLSVHLPDEDGVHVVHVQGRLRRGVRGPVRDVTMRLDRRAPTIMWVRPVLVPGPPASTPAGHAILVRTRMRGETDVGAAARCGRETADLPVLREEADAVRVASRVSAVDASVPMDRTCRLVVTASDAAGNHAVERRSVTVRRGAWEATTTADPAVMAMALEGQSFGLVARRGPQGVAVEVVLDGDVLGILDLWAPTPSEPEVVLSMDVPGSASDLHQLVLRAIDSAVADDWVAVIESVLEVVPVEVSGAASSGAPPPRPRARAGSAWW